MAPPLRCSALAPRHAALAALLAACSSISHCDDVAESVAAVDLERLRAHIADLHAIGPRPVSDAVATRATVDHLRRTLEGLGWEVHEETFSVEFPAAMHAIVRPQADPDAAPTEVAVEPELSAMGPHAMAGRSEVFRSQGLLVEGYRQALADPAAVFELPNLFATKPGRHPESGVVELSAHYDTIPHCPGANDNSSGMAALLEVARVLAEVELEQTVRLCFFGAEEVGLRGSRAYFDAHPGGFDPPVTALLNLDPIGFATEGARTQQMIEGVPTLVRWWLAFPDEANFIVLAGHADSSWLGALVEDAIDAYVPELPYYGANRIGHRFPDAQRSDHAHYWAAGIPALFLTDTGELRNDTYHGPRDTPDTLNYEFLTAVTRAAVAATLHLAERVKVKTR